MIKQTKIVATLGPASTNPKVIEAMINAGMNVARINFSHGDHAEHGERIDNARSAAIVTGQPIAILQDLCGPKIRIGDFSEGAVELKAGDAFTITTRKVVGDKEIVSVSLSSLPSCVQAGMNIMLEDGKYILKVVKVEGTDIHTKVVAGGHIRSRRGVNVPGAMLPIGAMTAKDKSDLAFGLTKNVDMVALSFVQTAKDITDLRKILIKAKSNALIIAKIETQSAIDNLDEIVAVTDGIMIARGDLAVEVPKEDVPLLQKRMIRMCRKLGKPVITATQMLDSMTESPVPTRAEVADVANAVFDGTDAVMLSQESAVGDDPALVVRTMASIAMRAETSDFYRETMEKRRPMNEVTTTDVTTLSATYDAHLLGAKAIVALTETGSTARMLSRHKPHLPIIALTPHNTVAHQLSVSFGIIPIFDRSRVTQFEEAVVLAKRILIEQKCAKKGDTFILVAGLPFGTTGSTNTCSIQVV
ncbi:MAG: pyruvate kinase [Candidatus Pacebacteria bacterium]|nr:pyruvate kinase [Candidatus Paceibacterota bacterium]MBP9832068.1 pyruvate kinase [Candidatus Paceibacterota bacterium]